MSIIVELQPQVYQTNLDNLILGSSDPVLGKFKGIPAGKFTNIEGPVTQFTSMETPFRITTDSPGTVHTIRATLISSDTRSNVLKVRNRIVEKQFVPVNTTTTVFIALLKGENQVDVFTDNDATFTSVTSSHTGTFATTYAREIFSSTQNPLNEQTRALFSNFSSRMTEILIPFQDLYADPKSLRTLISRFITRAYMTKSGSTQGVRDFAAALLGTTPIFVPTQTDQRHFEPNVVPLFRSQLEFSGYEAHTWIPNYEIVHWLAFVRLINNARHFYQIQEIGEHEILVLANGFAERHLFDFDDPASTAYSEFTFTDFRIIVEILDRLFIRFCAAAYPFDLFVSEENPLGQLRLAFDSTIPLDSGEALDAPALDPGDDGWVGLPLSGRFETLATNTDPVTYALDSLFITPNPVSGLEDCVFDGYFTQTVSTTSTEIPLDTGIDISGLASDALAAVTLESHDVENTLLDFSTFGEFSLSGGGSIAASTIIALAGVASVQHSLGAGPASPVVEWSGAAVDLSDAGGQTAYLTVYLGERAICKDRQVENIPAHPGNLSQIGVALLDTLGRERSWVFAKEDLVEGTNVLPIFLDFPDGGADDLGWDRAAVDTIRFSLESTASSAGWDDIYLGRLHRLDSTATYRPARAKIELEDIDNVSPESLWGSQLLFGDRFGTVVPLVADPVYNDDEDSAYFPGRYKIQRTAGVGTEGFDRDQTALNLQREVGRQIPDTVKAARVIGPNPEKYVNVFSSQFSPTGDRNTLGFTNPNAGPDLIDITGFSGGSVGLMEGLTGVSGSAIAQQFELSAGGAARFLELHLHRIGDPVGAIAVSLHEDNSGQPGNLIERAEAVLSRDIAFGVPNYAIFRLFTAVALSGSTPYWIVVSGNPTYVNGLPEMAADSDNQIIWTKKVGGYSFPRAETTPGLVPQAGSLWIVAAGEHHYFKIIGA
jgi:hypothetical protein